MTLRLFALNALLLSSCMWLEKAISPNDSIKDLDPYWLNVSLWVGPFYDHPALRLLNSKPFSTITDVETIDGFPVMPLKEDGIVPAGTMVFITDIQYPTQFSWLNRPMFSPKDRVWVLLRVAKERGRVNIFHERTHVLVLPEGLIHETNVRDYLKKFFSREDPNLWILGKEKHIREGIWQKHPVVGMKKDDVIATLGEPSHIKRLETSEDYLFEYVDYLVVFSKEYVTKVKKI